MFLRKTLYIDKSLSDYCNKTTKESMRKLTEKYNLEKSNPKIEVLTDQIEDPKINIVNFCMFLSVSSVAFFFIRNVANLFSY